MTLTSLGLAQQAPAGSEAKTAEQRVRRFIPYLAHYDGETLLTENDQLVQVIKLEGLAFQTRDEEELKRQKRFRNRLVRSIAKSDLVTRNATDHTTTSRMKQSSVTPSTIASRVMPW